MKFLILDIETIPRDDLPNSLDDEVAKKVQQRVERTGDDPEDAESLIRSVSPFFGRVLCIGMRLYDEMSGEHKDRVICEEDEKATLLKFAEIINHSNSRGLKFIHYNGLGFDIPFLIIRSAHHGIKIENRKFRNLRRFTYDNHIDLMMFLSGWSTYNAVSLDIVCQSFGIPSPKEGEVKGDSVATAYNDGEIDLGNEYVMRDVEATFQLYDKLKMYL